MKVQKVLVAGAGQMGAGIAQVSAQAGLDVVMIDVAEEFIAKGMAAIEKQLARAVEKGRIAAAARDAALARITTSLDMAAGGRRRPVRRGGARDHSTSRRTCSAARRRR